ncbi:hypothetical protein J7E79_30825, partial [Bacillus sp. ISL-40]|uniref:hypothetical protein n=1 Tax=Bacillus sp. ISL-40 TaxID=2819126 RepID=UPI001BE8F510
GTFSVASLVVGKDFFLNFVQNELQRARPWRSWSSCRKALDVRMKRAFKCPLKLFRHLNTDTHRTNYISAELTKLQT